MFSLIIKIKDLYHTACTRYFLARRELLVNNGRAVMLFCGIALIAMGMNKIYHNAEAQKKDAEVIAQFQSK